MATRETLDLSTTQYDRPLVRIDGVDYELRLPEELTFEEHGRRLELGAAATALGSRTEGLDKDAIDQIHAITVESARMLLVGVPDEVFRKLTPGHLKKITDFFNGLAGRTMSETASEEGGLSSVAGANDSTEAAA